MAKYFVYLMVVVSFFSCKKEELFSDIPEIRLINASPTVVTELQDPIFFEIEYTDGNGDLGENNPNTKNLTLVDPRINVKYEYRILELVPNQTDVPIKGTLIFNIPNAYITDGSAQQVVDYQIYVVDRAGNKSNIITAGPITINR